MELDPTDPSTWKHWKYQPRDDPRPTDELIAVALGQSSDDDAYWDAVWTLRDRHDAEVFDRALALGASACSHERALAASMLGHDLDRPSGAIEDRLAALRIMLNVEGESAVLGAILYALGHLHRPGVVEPALPFVSHPDTEVRRAAVAALSGQDDDRALAGLIALSRDPIAETRDWATFGLGSLTERDTPELRAALVARLDDDDPTVQGEALVGLARRRDDRGRPHLRDLLAARDVGPLELEAAEEWADPGYLPLLLALDRAEIDQLYALDAAIAACTPGEAAE